MESNAGALFANNGDCHAHPSSGVSQKVTCPICSHQVNALDINTHIDNGCHVPSSSQPKVGGNKKATTKLAPIFFKPNQSNNSQDPIPVGSPSPSISKGKKRAITDTPSSALIQSKRAKITQFIAPLAERMRPEHLDEFVGHDHLTNSKSMFMTGATNGSLGSMIFWGPPGCGKTTLARLYAKQTGSFFKELSATVVGINDIRAVFEEAKNTFKLTRRRTVLFLDEIHRFSRSQQDIFLPFVEQGSIQLLGATTENPSFKLTGALLSRCRVFVLAGLTDDDTRKIIHNALQKLSASSEVKELEPIDYSLTLSEPSSSQGSSQDGSLAIYPRFTDKIIASIVSLASGDARIALSLVELVVESNLPEDDLITFIKQSVSVAYDRSGDARYDMISALHKSVRASQGTAALYWLARMLTMGEDPLYIARRCCIIASEDVSMADTQALPLAVAALQACQNIGMPECRINLAHIVAYLSEAPKSTRAYDAYALAEAAARSDPSLPVPLGVRNAPTKLMSDMGCGKDYRYNPQYAHPVTNTCLPPQLQDVHFLKKEGDLTGKEWDEEALRQWELAENSGRTWDGRKLSDLKFTRDAVQESQ